MAVGLHACNLAVLIGVEEGGGVVEEGGCGGGVVEEGVCGGGGGGGVAKRANTQAVEINRLISKINLNHLINLHC